MVLHPKHQAKKLLMEPSQETDNGAATRPGGRPRGRPRKKKGPAPEGQTTSSLTVATRARPTRQTTPGGEAASLRTSPPRTRSGSRTPLPVSGPEAPPAKRRRKTRQTVEASGSAQAEGSWPSTSAVVASTSHGVQSQSHSSEMAPEAAGGSHPEVPVASTYPLSDAPASGLMPSGSPSGQPGARGEVASRGGGSEGPRVKRPDFQASENMTLVLAIIENWNSLYGAGARRVCSEAKMKIWSTVARRVSALGYFLRDARACQKRYGDIRSRIKLKMVRLSEMRQGVSGRKRAPPQFTEYEELLRPYVPDVTVEGVSAFGDTSLMAAERTSGPAPSARETSDTLPAAQLARPTVVGHGTQHPGPGQASRGEVAVPSTGEYTGISGAESVALESELDQHGSPPSPVVAHTQTSGGGAPGRTTSGDEGSSLTSEPIPCCQGPSSPASTSTGDGERHFASRLPLRQEEQPGMSTDPHAETPTSQNIGQHVLDACERIRQRLSNPPRSASPEFQLIAQLIHELVDLIGSIRDTLSSQQEGVMSLLERLESTMQHTHRERQVDLEASIRASVDACMSVATHGWHEQYRQLCAALIEQNAGTVNRFATVASGLDRALGAHVDVLQQIRGYLGHLVSGHGRWASHYPGGLSHPPPEPQYFPEPYRHPFPHAYPPSAPPPSYPMWPEPQPPPSQPPTSEPYTPMSTYPHPPPQPPPDHPPL